MLGEQLIKNDRIALVELIKNSYDADASRVWVDFVDFPDSLVNDRDSRIIITDDGSGMSEETIRDHWLNPATPSKHDFKRHVGRSPGGRVMQGEKGIGRFAMFKLGSHVKLVTRAMEAPDEFTADFDLSFLDSPSEGIDSSLGPSRSDQTSTKEHLFIDEIEVELTRRPPVVFTGESSGVLPPSNGTRVEISGLRSRWSRSAVKAAFADVARLQPLVPQAVADPMATSSDTGTGQDFEITFLRNGVDLNLRDEQEFDLRQLFDDRAVLRVTGHFSDTERSFLLNINDHVSVISLDDAEITGLRIYRRYFANEDSPSSSDDLACGPFDFSFYVFDLTANAPVEYRLDPDERRLVREHRIYLYRDGVRVLPYGDVEDDWLQLDVIRGTQAAGRVLSNDQTVGFVYITQEQNPLLQDKTNREGLLDSGHALSDFVTLLQLVISYVRRADFARYLAREEQKREIVARREKELASDFRVLREDTRLPPALARAVAELEQKYDDERAYMDLRVERTEDLAGVGLSVEAASHDIVSTANQALRLARAVADHLKAFMPDQELLVRNSRAVVEGLSFVTSRLEDVQGLFVSTRSGKKLLDPAEYVSKAYRIYAHMAEQHGVGLDLRRSRPPLKVRTTEAALLQVFVNLFDNAIYWLTTTRTLEPTIRVVVERSKKQLVFADNGPGVREEDEPFIFEPFFSGKGEAGKGLGLYIARHVSLRNGFEIDLITSDEHKIATGANFILRFPGESVDE
jgi:signal transduction histidine kinase